MLNSFFLQGSNTEQGLVQDLINEQLKIYGIEVYYMPREIISEGKVIRDVIYSKFKSAFPIEAYLMNYEGFEQNSVLMSKFGVRVTDEMTLIISKERFELYISEFMKGNSNVKNYLRPNEGDLIYIPLSDSLMEIKFVENRKPFYQLQKNYVYELRCEVYELEDDEIDTSFNEIDNKLLESGYGAKLYLSSIGSTATAYTTLVSGGVQKIDLINGGYGYSSAPTVVVSSPTSGTQATAVGVLTSSSGLTAYKSLSQIYIENPGSGYNTQTPPTVSFFGGGGYNSSATVSVASTGGIGPIVLTSPGQGYYEEPVVTISSPVGGGVTAIAKAFLNSSGGISTIRIINAGYGYTEVPTVTISAGSSIANGNFILGEKVSSSNSNAGGIVKSWNPNTNELIVSGFGTDFTTGDTIIGLESNSTYIVRTYESDKLLNSYANNDKIEEEADDIIDFSENNPFGEV